MIEPPRPISPAQRQRLRMLLPADLTGSRLSALYELLVDAVPDYQEQTPLRTDAAGCRWWSTIEEAMADAIWQAVSSASTFSNRVLGSDWQTTFEHGQWACGPCRSKLR